MSGGRFGSASGIRRTINATLSPFKSFRQITPSHRRHIPVRRERRIKGERFSGFIRSEGPRRQMQDFKRWVKGELHRRNRKFYKTEGDTDFRERVSRSIWPSKLVRSCYRILPAKWILSFTEEVSPALCVSVGWGGVLFCRRSSLFVTFFKRCICRGTFRLEETRKQRSAFSQLPFSAGIWVAEVTSE